MRKLCFLALILLLMGMGISACNGAAGSNSSATAGVQSSGPLTTGYKNALSIEMQLVFGTLNLDGTENAVSAQEAIELLPLWKAVRSLTSSDTAATEEIEALFTQIQETMTPEQVQAIAAMQLTQEDMAQIAQERGLELFVGRGQLGEMTPEMQATMQALRESGQMPEGDFQPPEGGFGNGGGAGPGGGGFAPGGGGGFAPGGGGGFAQGGTVSPELQSTAEARRAGGRTRLGMSSAVLDAIIQYLEGVSSSKQ